jgi:solute carrier family 8 (sodium/calcium exchanger)
MEAGLLTDATRRQLGKDSTKDIPRISNELNEECFDGLFLPLFEDVERTWSEGMRAAIYFFGLVWMFLGVAIISDVFMSSIDRITAKQKLITKKGRKVHVKVWNDTVANLTLMALGSSAPEILLAVIETLGNNFYSGKLGPSTIVGSAAFNLLCIIAVCVYVIPDGEFRYVKVRSVFVCTACWSMFAYIWVVFILMVTSPNAIDIVEGVLTFLFFPMMVLSAFLYDIGYFGAAKQGDKESEVRSVVRASLLAQTSPPASGASNARQSITADIIGNVQNKVLEKADNAAWISPALKQWKLEHELQDQIRDQLNQAEKENGHDAWRPERAITIEFAHNPYWVQPDENSVQLTVTRHGPPGHQVAVKYHTIDDEATVVGGKDYISSVGSVVFPVGVNEAKIAIPIIEEEESFVLCNDGFKESKGAARLGHFDVALSDAIVVSHQDKRHAPRVVLGEVPTVTVMMGCENGHPGILKFQKPIMPVGAPDKTVSVKIIVMRIGGISGDAKCTYRTEKITAVPDFDYKETSGELLFPDGTALQAVEVEVLPKDSHERADEFIVVLEDVEGAVFDPDDNGGPDSSIAIVQIGAGEKQHEFGLFGMVDEYLNEDMLRHSWEEWKNQFKVIRWVNGSMEDQKEAGYLDFVYHIVSLPFQFVFATVPPPSYFGGWVTFVAAIGYIGVVTAVIGDLASILGCLIKWDDQLTAITIVALGTSLPDTFASMTSAVAEEYADNSIGNVTGSNSVNVFLGLGMPWTMAACYWNFGGYGSELPMKWIHLNNALEEKGYVKFTEPSFIVVAGDLSFSVISFLVTCVVTLSVIFLRREIIGAELGGPKGPKIATSILFVGCWLFYVFVSFWKLKHPDATTGEQATTLAIGIGGLLLCAGILGIIIIKLVKDGGPAARITEAKSPSDSPLESCEKHLGRMTVSKE